MTIESDERIPDPILLFIAEHKSFPQAQFNTDYQLHLLALLAQHFGLYDAQEAVYRTIAKREIDLESKARHEWKLSNNEV